MGTNYDLHIPGGNKCDHCGRSDGAEILHIGKSSGGWVFTLQIYPDRGINDLDDWRPLFERGQIFDEYGVDTTSDEMIDVICNRKGPGFDSDEKARVFYERNHAAPGPNGLVRHELGSFCIRHGSGTWDCVVGDFS